MTEASPRPLSPLLDDEQADDVPTIVEPWTTRAPKRISGVQLRVTEADLADDPQATG